MSCYHPLIGVVEGIKDNGKKKIRIIKNVESIDYEKNDENGVILLPCGHCIGCRLDYSRSWADRMMLELETAKKAIFLTLTYDNDHIHWTQFNLDDSPMFGTLDKRDCQLFMKRLRKAFDGVKIRFFLAGEYGNKTGRPHYHAIVYGLGLSDFEDLYCIGRNELGQKYFNSPCLAKIWNNGFVLIADVSWKSCAYVARYVTKKFNGEKAVEYAKRNVIPEFSLMSRKPGIGAEYLQQHPDCFEFSKINLSTSDGGLSISIPKYYLRQLELTDKEKFDIIKEERRKYSQDTTLIELSRTELSYLDYLEVKENKKLSQIKQLKRK